jgi:flagellar biosynthesis/type III secretory pathway M-ring protein FliF/YscJ
MPPSPPTSSSLLPLPLSQTDFDNANNHSPSYFNFILQSSLNLVGLFVFVLLTLIILFLFTKRIYRNHRIRRQKKENDKHIKEEEEEEEENSSESRNLLS